MSQSLNYVSCDVAITFKDSKDKDSHIKAFEKRYRNMITSAVRMITRMTLFVLGWLCHLLMNYPQGWL